MGDERIELGLVAPGEDHMRAEPREQPGDGAADAAGAARDQRDLVLQRVGGIDRRMRREIWSSVRSWPRCGEGPCCFSAS